MATWFRMRSGYAGDGVDLGDAVDFVAEKLDAHALGLPE